LHQVLQPRTNSHKAENKSSRLQRKTTSSCGMMWVKKTLYKKMGKEHRKSEISELSGFSFLPVFGDFIVFYDSFSVC
ncbi:MAG: hypothetical protein IJK65_11610, partial [Clostridiales bacterium]|nr:hypothetical protein [Clostridiales bacterium]